MSNLGLYQLMVVAAKRVGGPKVLFGLIALGGALVTEAVDFGVRRIKKAVNKKQKEKAANIVHIINQDGVSDEGLSFKAGDKFKVLSKIEDVGLLIEKLGDEDNPYFVPIEFISSISDYAMT